MIRSILAFLKTYRKRLFSMSLIFWLVTMIIVLVDQVIFNIKIQINEQTKPLVWADIVIQSNQPFSGKIINIVKEFWNNPLTRILSYTEYYTTLENTSTPKLIQVQWIEKGFPLYGKLEIRPLLSELTSQDIGTFTWAFVDQQTYELLNSWFIVLGNESFKIWGIIISQPTTTINLFNEGRVVLIPYNKATSINLTSLGSRVEYQFQIKTSPDQLPLIESIIKNKFWEQYQVTNASDRIQQLEGLTWQLDQYISIIIVITIVLSLVIMTTAIMTMTLNIKQSIAIMRILGLTKKATTLLCITTYATMFVLGAMFWIMIAKLIFNTLTFFPLTENFIRSWNVVLTVMGVSTLSFIITCRNSLRLLITTEPLILLKSEELNPDKDQITTSTLYIIGVWCIVFLLTQNLFFSVWVTIGWSVLIFLISKALTLGFSYLKKRSINYRKKRFWRFDAIRQTTLPWNQTTLLVGGLTASLLSFGIIVSISISFLDRLQISSTNQPNLFVLNVRTQDIETIKKSDSNARLYDSILARIQSINKIPLSTYLETLELQWGRQWEFTREFNITTTILDNSPITQWISLEKNTISLDEDFARRLKVARGNTITLSIQWRIFDLTIINLRKSIRSGSEPFFFMQLESNQFASAPKSWFWITRQPESELNQFKKNALKNIGPHLSFIDIGAIINLVTDVSSKIIAVVIGCMAIIITLIIIVSIVSNESSALISKKSYRLYYILGTPYRELINKSWRTVGIYTAVIILFLIILTPLILIVIYQNSPILNRQRKTLIPISIGIIITLSIMILSYRRFHHNIINQVIQKNQRTES